MSKELFEDNAITIYSILKLQYPNEALSDCRRHT